MKTHDLTATGAPGGGHAPIAAKTAIDLIPREVTKQRVTNLRLLGWAVVAVAVAAVLLLMSALTIVQVYQARASLAPLRTQVLESQAVLSQVAPLTAQLEAIAARQQAINPLLYEPPWTSILHDVAAAASEFVWVESLELERTLALRTGEGAQNIVISGTAASDRDLVRFMNRLGESAYIAELSLQSSEIASTGDDETAGAVGYTLQGTLIAGEGTANGR